MLYNNVEQAAPALAGIVRDKRHILIVTHVNPDGDAIGSLTGLGLALEQLGHRVSLVTPTPMPRFVANIPGAGRVQSWNSRVVLPEDVDLVVLVDTGDVRRIGRVWEEAQAYLLQRPIAVIDHHVTNTGEGAVNYVDPGRSSTCELIYELLRAWDFPIGADVATSLLFGILTDTQNFKTSNTTPSALYAAAALLERGADRTGIVRDIYASVPYTGAQIMGRALMAMQRDTQIVWTHVSLVMQEAVGIGDDEAAEAASEVTDYLSTLGRFRASVLFKERRDGTVKVSMRSAPPVDVSAVAQQFGGGGHRQAAGCTLTGSLADAEARLLPALRASITALGLGDELAAP